MNVSNIKEFKQHIIWLEKRIKRRLRSIELNSPKDIQLTKISISLVEINSSNPDIRRYIVQQPTIQMQLRLDRNE